MSVAFVFPGLGSERPGMLHRLPDTAASATVLAEAEWSHPGGIAELDTADALADSPTALHVALLIAGVAGARALIEDEGVRPTLVAGHGTGGYAAAVIAGVLTFEEALKSARLRGELLERGTEPASDVAIRLAQHLATIVRRPQQLPYVTSAAATGTGYGPICVYGDTNAVFDDLARSVALLARWDAMARALADTGVSCFVELPPGRELTRHSGTLPSRMHAVSVEEHGIAETAERARTVSVGLAPA
ncbi:acyltransferase domain-containing protein [Streptomyces sp. AJS327]|uniref:acyltransferase domain-containing protein n=1 Tax=Streptomyces sp. AJS327 TaxID=2545265 RepID=UPI0015E02386|nr:acyltransferase domain-containing protein [Streptomyces sp. AJS327]MBA0053404.1 acyltransferase domain-containing protein [Streptomyces sp. AJS327]